MIHKHVRKLVLKTNYGPQKEKKKKIQAVKEVPDMSRKKRRMNDECKDLSAAVQSAATCKDADTFKCVKKNEM